VPSSVSNAQGSKELDGSIEKTSGEGGGMAQTEIINRNMGGVKAIDGGVGALDDGEEYMGGVKGTCRDLPITAKL
jgi:hypothetical protein